MKNAPLVRLGGKREIASKGKGLGSTFKAERDRKTHAFAKIMHIHKISLFLVHTRLWSKNFQGT
jgi:hypothetical protein